MTEPLDPRIRFYLQHEQLIEEWAAVRDDATRFAHEFYLDLAEDLEDAVADLEPDVLVFKGDESYSYVGLARTTWPAVDGVPLAMVRLEWKRNEAHFVTGWRGVGVRCQSDLPEGKLLRGRIADQIRDHRVELGFPKSTSWWATYRDEPGATGAPYWEHLDDFRVRLVASTIEAWQKLAGAIDRASVH